jgi:hypothetical protein
MPAFNIRLDRTCCLVRSSLPLRLLRLSLVTPPLGFRDVCLIDLSNLLDSWEARAPDPSSSMVPVAATRL